MILITPIAARGAGNCCSLLHVVHHGILPLSCWPGIRWFVGGHASFFCMLNCFVHVVMYTYYSIAAMGPEYQVGMARCFQLRYIVMILEVQMSPSVVTVLGAKYLVSQPLK